MKPDYTAVAAALLRDVGLSFDDVFDLGRSWRRGPVGFETRIGRPHFEGVIYPFNPSNPTSRQRQMIGLTGPVDCDAMVLTLAHECGHAARRHHHRISTPEYIQEYEAEIYALEKFEEIMGRPAHPYFFDQGKKYVRKHCWSRFRIMGPSPIVKGWRRDVIEWCEFPQRLLGEMH